MNSTAGIIDPLACHQNVVTPGGRISGEEGTEDVPVKSSISPDFSLPSAQLSFWPMKIREIMTRGVFTTSPDDPLVEAAGLMRLHDVGVLPVVENGNVVGIITDRDIVLRGVAEGVDVQTMQVRDAMSVGSISISEEQTIDEAATLMQQYQVRRLPVLDAAGVVVGMISLGDLAVDVHAGLSGKVLKEVSEPAAPLA